MVFDADQAKVALEVTVGVVEGLEVVDVEQNHRQGQIGPDAAAPLELQHTFKFPSVGDVRQRIETNRLLELVAPLLGGQMHFRSRLEQQWV
jgi:hypothetical protein